MRRNIPLILLMTFFSWFPLRPACADLTGYVQKADASFAWSLVGQKATEAGIDLQPAVDVADMAGNRLETPPCRFIAPKMRSNRRNIDALEHRRRAGAGRGCAHVWNWRLRQKSPVAVLYDVPNQPLLGDKSEDALIAETFVRYLKTGDSDWPLLFPMVKSVVRAMDALQAFSQQEWKHPLKDFVVTGASKRGWTSWLTAACGDKRVKAIAPMVIDTLNMPEQNRRQRESYGTLSAEIDDYTKNGLTEVFRTPEGQKLLNMVDPYRYRAKLHLPKLMINGANDPYWCADSLRLYWDALPGEKWVTYVPNAGHNLQEKLPGGAISLKRSLSVLAAFIRSQSGGPALARLNWKERERGAEPYSLTLTTNQTPRAARFWSARSATRDFRPQLWEATPLAVNGKQISGVMEKPGDGYRAVFAELEFGEDGATYTLCTPIRVLSAMPTP